jgi:magnesium chelatase accessory protein
MEWARQGADWPNRSASRFVRAGGLRFHVQVMGQGPGLLLVHGTGSATHSFRDMLPLLARDFTVMAADLPGHGFTGAPPSWRMTLPDMSAALGDVLAAMDMRPDVVAAHSAGAAIAARMALDGRMSPRLLVSLNGALLPIPGLPGQFFSGVAKTLARIPVVPWLFSWRAGDRASVAKMLAGTGSSIDPAGIDLYARLLRDTGHVANVLAMMANWELEKLARDLPHLSPHLLLVVADGDKAVPMSVARKVARLVPGSEVVVQAGLGHLSHEERPAETASLILRAARDAGVFEAVT